MATEAQWRPDPTGAHELRCWNGTDWTEHVSDAGVQSTAPLGTVPVVSPPPATPAAATPPAAGWVAPTTPEKRPAVTVNPVVGWIVLAGAAIAAIGSCLPWARFSALGESQTHNGLGNDGEITLVLAIAIGVLVYPLVAGPLLRRRAIAVIVLGAIVVLVAVLEIADVSTAVDDELEPLVDVSVSCGLWMTLVGGLVAAGGSIAALVQNNPAERT